jgi:nucleolar protein 53
MSMRAAKRPNPVSESAKNSSVTKSAAGLRRNSAPSALGAPSQHNQASRKGRRAWRKNVDIEDVEEALEGLRTEERVTGYVLELLV